MIASDVTVHAQKLIVFIIDATAEPPRQHLMDLSFLTIERTTDY